MDAPASPVGPYALPPLKFAYDALEPVIDAETMRLHYGKYHQGYVGTVNMAFAKHPQWLGKPIEEVLHHLPELPDGIRQAVRDQDGGHANHQFSLLSKALHRRKPWLFCGSDKWAA